MPREDLDLLTTGTFGLFKSNLDSHPSAAALVSLKPPPPWGVWGMGGKRSVPTPIESRPPLRLTTRPKNHGISQFF